MAILRKIFTIWLNEKNELPEMIQKCIESQKKVLGYEHKLITLDNCDRSWRYARECIESKYTKQKWCKLADFLRFHYLYTEGGIYLDADVEVLAGKNFDDMLSCEMFAGVELGNFIGTGMMGAEKGSPFMKEMLRLYDENFLGSGEITFEMSMQLFSNKYWKAFYEDRNKYRLYPIDFFTPYNHQTGETKITENTRTYHHFLRSWVT